MDIFLEEQHSYFYWLKSDFWENCIINAHARNKRTSYHIPRTHAYQFYHSGAVFLRFFCFFSQRKDLTHTHARTTFCRYLLLIYHNYAHPFFLPKPGPALSGLDLSPAPYTLPRFCHLAFLILYSECTSSILKRASRQPSTNSLTLCLFFGLSRFLFFNNFSFCMRFLRLLGVFCPTLRALFA